MEVAPPNADPETAPVTVLVVDDQAPFRMAARLVVKRAPGFTLVGEAEDGERAVDMAGALDPDLILMDINLPGINGVEATRRILAEEPDAVVFLLSTYALADLPAGATESGARGYMSKEDFGTSALRRLWTDRECEFAG